jgi:hypothetical protein
MGTHRVRAPGVRAAAGSVRGPGAGVRVIAYIPDLLFGSGVIEGLRSAGHEPVLVGDPAALAEALPGSEVLIVDLTSDPQERIAVVGQGLPAGVRTLGFYSHVEADVRAQAQEAGFDQVVPRSRMAREGVALVERLSGQA